MRYLIILAIFGAIAYGAYAFFTSDKANEVSDFVYDTDALDTKQTVDKELAILRAKEVWAIAINTGRDLSSGPCLDNSLIDGWVLDIAHNPRQESDNLPENQCDAYLNGTAKHFVELDLEGNLIRVE